MAKIIFFSPHSYVWDHAFPEALVADSLKRSGHEVVYVTCGQALSPFCISMQSTGMSPLAAPAEKDRICRECTRNANVLTKRFGFRAPTLMGQVTQAERLEVQRILAGVTLQNFLDLGLEGVPLGRIALYEFLLQHKKQDLNLSDTEFREYLPSLESALLCWFGAKRILDQEKPDQVLVYNSLYSANAVFTQVAKLRGVQCYFMHAGTNLAERLDTAMIGLDFTWQYFKNLVRDWPKFRDQPCLPSFLTGVTDHILQLVQGTSVLVYSAGKGRSQVDIRQRFGIQKDQKILVASMSSYDERFAVETVGAFPPDDKLLFPKQVHWIQALVEKLKSRPEWFLIIRVHPREFPNKREGVTSEHAKMLEKVLVDLPPNVRVDWPKDKLSIYDLAQETDVFLNAWSSVGKEMGLLGIPTVVYSSELILYPEDLNFIGRDLDRYFAEIERALKEGFSFERIRKTYRWYALEFYRANLPLTRGFGSERVTNWTLWERLKARGKRVFVPLYDIKSDLKKYSLPPSSDQILSQFFAQGAPTPLGVHSVLNSSSTEEETQGLKNEMGRLAKVLFSQDGMKTPLQRKWEQVLNSPRGGEG